MRTLPARPLAQFALLLAFLGALTVSMSAVLTSRPPWYPLLRARQLGWHPAAWDRRLSGTWRFGFEVSAFVPCPGQSSDLGPTSAPWWASYDAQSWRELRQQVWGRGRLLPDTAVFVVWTADVSSSGAYGHLGGYTREIAVHRVVRVDSEGPDACARAMIEPELGLAP